MIRRVLLAGGGTGGHLFPGIAVVEELRRRLPELEVLYCGTERGIEARVLPKMNERFEPVDVRPLLGRTPLELARSVLSLPGAGARALSVVRSFRPDLVIGLGGYAAGPIVLSAAACRIPTALLEQNAHVGLTNRMLAHVVGRAYLSFEETVSRFGSERGRVLGNPVRRAFVDAARMARHDPVGSAGRGRRVLVFGGSQGARALNQVVPEALADAGLGEQGIGIVHQTGADMLQEVEQRYRALGLQAEVLPFIDDMARAYLGASLVIARAGATTLAELCAVGRPSILVPFPHAAEDHQLKNALAMQRAGAAVAIAERDLSKERLSSEVAALLRDPTRRREMAHAALGRGRPDAAAAIVDDLLQWLGVPSAAAPASEPDEPPAEANDEPADTQGARIGQLTRRRPRVTRCQLRLRTLADAPTQAAG